VARTEARIHTRIWLDKVFLALSVEAQRMYMFLISQPELAHDGVLFIADRPWARTAAGLTLGDVHKALAELEATEFVVIDEDAMQLLIRSFMRNDKVYRQPNVLRSARDHLRLVRSLPIRARLAVELRLIAELPELSKECASIIAAMLAEVEPAGQNPTETLPEGFDEPLAEGSQLRHGVRGVVTVVPPSFPSPLTPRPAAPASPLRGRERRSAVDIVIEINGADEAEAAEVVDRIRRTRKPDSIDGFVATLARDGDLVDVIDEVRAERRHAATAAQVAATRHGPECPHRVPGGSDPHPESGEPMCPNCRAEHRARGGAHARDS
jgi:hypothetical protein